MYQNKILVVDANEDVFDFIKILLEQITPSFEHAKNLPDAMALFGQWKPNLVIADATLSNWRGYEIIQAFRNQLQSTKIIILVPYYTDPAATVTTEFLLNLGADVVLKKEDITQKLEAATRLLFLAQKSSQNFSF